MASPQLEKGHTRIAHDILEAIVRSNLSAHETKTLVWVLRLTYGFHRKDAYTNTYSISKKLRVSRETVRDVICKLEAVNILKVEWSSADLCKIVFNKNYDSWSCFV